MEFLNDDKAEEFARLSWLLAAASRIPPIAADMAGPGSKPDLAAL
jgi:hypothetical protein